MNSPAPEPNQAQRTQAKPDYFVSGWDLTWMLADLGPARCLSHDALTVEACRLRLMSEGFDESDVGDGLVIPVAEEDDGGGGLLYIYDVHFVVKDEFVCVQLALSEGELRAWYLLYEQFEECAGTVAATMLARADERVLVNIHQGPQATTMDILFVNHEGTVWSLKKVQRSMPGLIAAIEANPRIEEQ